jgi:hypothetical protein
MLLDAAAGKHSLFIFSCCGYQLRDSSMQLACANSSSSSGCGNRQQRHFVGIRLGGQLALLTVKYGLSVA